VINDLGRMAWVDKVVYGAVALRHDYRCDAQDQLLEARISMLDEGPKLMSFTA
jgi:hypothetical protein